MAKNTSLKEFVKRVLDAVTPRVSKIQEQLAKDFFEEVKKEIIQDIIKHPISQELINHTSPSPLLGTNGSLYGFLGIRQGIEPVTEILKVVESKMRYTVSKRLVRRSLKMTVILPTIEDFRTPELILEWEGGRGVVDGIENGISGLSYYIQSGSARSRSKEGLQSKNAIRQREFRGKNWISNILNSVQSKANKFK